MKSKLLKTTQVIGILLGLGLSACSGGHAQQTDEGGSAGSTNVSQTAAITTTGYFNAATRFNLYLKNTSSESVELSSASLDPDSNTDGAFALYSWKVGDDSTIISDTFTGTTLPSGATITFTIHFLPTALKTHNAAFQVFYTTGGGGIVEFDIVGNVVKGTPPGSPSQNGNNNNNGGNGNNDNGENDNGGNDDNGGDTNGGGSETDTPAAELTGDKVLKITHMYALIAKNSPVVGDSPAKVNVGFDADTKIFTFYEVQESDGFIIPTAEGGTFSGQPFVVTTNTDATGDFDSTSGSEIVKADAVALTLFAANVNSPIGDSAKQFGFSATIDFTTGDTAIPSDLTADDIGQMKTGFNTDNDYVSDTAITGIYPSDATRDIALVGCGKIPFTSVKAGSAGKSAFSDPDTTICAVIQGQIIEKN